MQNKSEQNLQIAQTEMMYQCKEKFPVARHSLILDVTFGRINKQLKQKKITVKLENSFPRFLLLFIKLGRDSPVKDWEIPVTNYDGAT
jgi:hypothetical protein